MVLGKNFKETLFSEFCDHFSLKVSFAYSCWVFSEVLRQTHEKHNVLKKEIETFLLLNNWVELTHILKSILKAYHIFDKHL